MKTIKIDPFTRISGIMSITVKVQNNRVVNAEVSGNQFRGFEKMFQGRSPLDIIRLVPRVCGICSTHHTVASIEAIENMMNIKPSFNGKLVRDITNGFEFLQNYLRHIYFFVFPDYVKVTELDPLIKTTDEKYLDYRLNKKETDKINADYIQAIERSGDAHRIIGLLAGKVPHCHGNWIGGTTTKIDIPQIEQCRYNVNNIKEFVSNSLIPDMEIIANRYSDYYRLGKGHGNLMSFGIFKEYDAPIKYIEPSVSINGVYENFDANNITESIKSTWANGEKEVLIPGKNMEFEPNAFKEGAYSWVNAPRYKKRAMEVGALARMTLSGNYTGGISTMDRLLAKVYEARKMCEILEGLIDLLEIGEAYQEVWEIPSEGEGFSLIEAERGALGHWISVKNRKVENYNLIPPSTWNMSPTDDNGVKGTVEEALMGTYIQDPSHPVEVGRIVRSFDPCLNCAAHVVSDRYEPVCIEIIS